MARKLVVVEVDEDLPLDPRMRILWSFLVTSPTRAVALQWVDDKGVSFSAANDLVLGNHKPPMPTIAVESLRNRSPIPGELDEGSLDSLLENREV